MLIPQPWDFIELRLCSEVYGCTPSQLYNEDWATVNAHLALWNAWQEHQREEAKKKKRRAPRGRT